MPSGPATADGKDKRNTTVVPLRSEGTLRRLAWIEGNRKRVDELSDGKLAYIWVPNTGGGVWTFDRYFFAQQDKLGAVVDERFNGGGLLDDYMVDLMTRELRAAITNEPDEGERLQEQKVKEMTGGDEMLVRNLHSDFVAFTPYFKLAVTGNHKLEIRGTDDGIWRKGHPCTC